MKKLLFATILFLGLFLGIEIKADQELYQARFRNYEAMARCNTSFPATYGNGFGQWIYVSENTQINQIQFLLAYENSYAKPNDNLTFELRKDDVSGTLIQSKTISASEIVNSRQASLAGYNDTPVTIQLTPYILEAGHYYFLELKRSSTACSPDLPPSSNYMFGIGYYDTLAEQQTAMGKSNSGYANYYLYRDYYHDWGTRYNDQLGWPAVWFNINGDTSSASWTIDSPTNYFSYNSNNINFKGTATNATSVEIKYSESSSTSTIQIFSTTTPTTGYSWDFNYNMPLGRYYIWYWFCNDWGCQLDYQDIEVGNLTNPITGTETPTVNLTATSTYYCDNLPNIFYGNGSSCPASSIVYSGMTNLGGKVLQPAMDFMSGFYGFFATEKAAAYASTTAGAVNVVWSYGQGINQVMSLPIFEILLLFVLVNISILVFKGVWYLIKVIR